MTDFWDDDRPRGGRRSLTAPIRDDLDLLEVWRVVAPVRYPSRTLLMLLIGPDGVPAPQLTEIDAWPDAIDVAACDGLAEMCSLLLTDVIPGGSVALALGRPGSRLLGPGDREWANAILTATAARDVTLRTLHLATPDGVRPLALDDVLTG